MHSSQVQTKSGEGCEVWKLAILVDIYNVMGHDKHRLKIYVYIIVEYKPATSKQNIHRYTGNQSCSARAVHSPSCYGR